MNDTPAINDCLLSGNSQLFQKMQFLVNDVINMELYVFVRMVWGDIKAADTVKIVRNSS